MTPPNERRPKRGAPRSPEGVPATIGALLEPVARRAAPGRVPPDVWERVVGERIAQRASAHALRGRTLVVHVANAAWAQELTFLAPTILRKLGAERVDVAELRFRVGEVTPPRRAARVQPGPVEPAPLPAPLARRLANVHDAELRDAIAAAAGHWRAQALAAQRARASKAEAARRRRLR